MTRYLPLLLALNACAAPMAPPTDAPPDASAEPAADVASAPDAAVDAAELPDAASLGDAQHDALPDATTDVADAVLDPDVADASVRRPNIGTEHDAMTVVAALRLTCAPSMGVGTSDYCDAVITMTFEGGCSVRGARFQVGFSPFSCGIRCYSINAAVESRFASVTVDSGGNIASGTNVWLTPGREWVDRSGQRRQNFYMRVRMDPNAALNVRGIAGVTGVTDLLEYADIYALGCPKGP